MLKRKRKAMILIFKDLKCLTEIFTFVFEVESIAGAPGVLASPFAAMHGLPSPLAGPYNGVAPAGSLAGLGGFNIGGNTLGVRVPGSPQPSAVLLVSNLNEEVRVNFPICWNFHVTSLSSSELCETH